MPSTTGVESSIYKAAEREFDDAIAYYERELPSLGGRFRQAVQSALGRIKSFPEAYSPLSQRTRRCLVSKFPYGMIDKVQDNEIVVVAVAHLHRKPDYWTSRER